MNLHWLLNVVFVAILLSSVNASIKQAGRSRHREPRLFNALSGLSGIKVHDEFHQNILEMQNRIDSVFAKITNFEKIRAKNSDATAIFNLLETLSDICPPNTNSLRVGSKCFEHVVQNWMDYDSAYAYCKGRGGYLAIPNVTDSNYLENLRQVFPSLGDDSVLVGITDMEKEGRFVFLDNSIVPPDRFPGGKCPLNDSKDCVSVVYAGGFGLTDTTCKFLHEVLCEYNPVNLLPEILHSDYY